MPVVGEVSFSTGPCNKEVAPHYFLTHTVHVLIEHPLQSLLRGSDFTRKIAMWGTRLGSLM